MPPAKLPVFGQFPDHKRPKKAPITVQIAAYDNDGVEHIQTFHFVGWTKFASRMEISNASDADGNVRTPAIARYLASQIVAEDREAFISLIENPDLDVEETAILEVFTALGEMYSGARPTT